MQTVVNTIPLPLSYENLQGSILTRISAGQAQYKAGAVVVNITRFETDFSLARLLSGRLSFHNVRASEVEVILARGKTDVPPQEEVTVGETGARGLPVTIALNDVDIKTVRIAGEQQTHYTFSDIVLQKGRIRENFTFRDLSFAMEPGIVSATGSIGFSASAAVELAANWQTRAGKQFPATRGSVSVKGAFQHFTVNSQIDAPELMVLQGEIDRRFSEFAWKASIKGGRLPLVLFRPGINAELVNFEFDANGELDKLTIEGRSELRDAALGRWSAGLNANFDASRIELTTLTLKSLDSSTTVSISGSTLENFKFANAGPLKVITSWKDVQWPLSGAPVLVSEGGQMEIAGSINGYRVRLANAGLEVNGHKVTNLNATGQANAKNLQLADFRGNYLAGLWQGKGRMDWEKDFIWDAAVTVKGMDPSVRWPQWPASLKGTVNISGYHKADGWQLTGDIKQVEGKFAGAPIDYAATGFELTKNIYTVRNFDFKAQQNRIRGTVQLKLAAGARPHINASWNINAQNLSQLLPEMNGAITSQGNLRGEMMSPHLSASIQAQDLAYRDYRLAAVSGTVNIDPSINSRLSIDLELDDLAVGENKIQQVLLKGRGTTGDHELVLNSAMDDRRSLQLAARGAYAGEAWNGKLFSSSIKTAYFGEWKQQQPSNVSVTLARLAMERYCLTPVETDASVCLQIRFDQFDAWKGAISVKDLPVATFKKYFPPQIISAEGFVSGSANYHFQKNVIRHFQAGLASSNGKVVYGFAADDRQDMQYRRLQVDVTHTDQGMLIKSKMDLGEMGEADIRASLLDKHALSVLDAAQQIQGRVTMDLKSLTILPLIFTDIQYIEGRKYSEYTVSGTIGNPVVTGHSDITATSVTLPRLGIELKDVRISATSDKNNNITVAGEARSGGGKIVINGEMLDYRNADLLAKLQIQGETFLAARLPEIVMEVSPQITVIVKNEEVRLEGELAIPKAHIQILQSIAAVSPSADVVMLNGEEKPAQAAKKLKLSAELKVTLGHDVKLEGFGVSSRLRGEVLVREEPDGATLGTGEISFAEGRYAAYNRELVVDSGRLTYASSPIDNPIVAIKAMRRIDYNTKVGVMVTGHAQSPAIELFSEPAMDKSDILSYLVLGYPMSQASKSDGSTLASAAGSIGLIGGEIMAKQIAGQFGIDDVKVTSDSTTQQTSLALGKYLSPRLYAQYAMGIGQAVNTFRIEYELTSRWVIRTEASSEQQGADLFYTIEVD